MFYILKIKIEDTLKMVLSEGCRAALEPASKSPTSEHSSVPSLETEMGMDVWMGKKAGS